MKVIRSMVLISHDLLSIQRGADRIEQVFREELHRYGLQDEVSISLIDDVGHSFALPLVIIYPEAVIYGPVSPQDVPLIIYIKAESSRKS
jgi:NADP-reducing hydrogenase subunit HndC